MSLNTTQAECPIIYAMWWHRRIRLMSRKKGSTVSRSATDRKRFRARIKTVITLRIFLTSKWFSTDQLTSSAARGMWAARGVVSWVRNEFIPAISEWSEVRQRLENHISDPLIAQKNKPALYAFTAKSVKDQTQLPGSSHTCPTGRAGPPCNACSKHSICVLRRTRPSVILTQGDRAGPDPVTSTVARSQTVVQLQYPPS
jgi:hypothetical protein